MTEFIGVYSKLRDPQLSWEKKISIAQNAWNNDKCFIPNKRQVLLDWVCQKLVDHILYKKDKRNGVVTQASTEISDLWVYLKNILQSILKPADGGGSVSVPLSLMPQFLQVFTKTFSDHCTSEACSLSEEQECVKVNIIHCGQMILSCPNLHTSLIAKFENNVMFMSSLLSSFGVFMTVNHSINHKICKEMFYLLEVSLNLYSSSQRRQTNHRKLFERTCEHLVGPLLTVRYILKNINQQCDGNTCEIAQERITSLVHLLHKSLSKALFRREHLSDYISTLKILKAKTEQDDTTEPQNKKACLGNYTKLLFVALENLLSTSKDMNNKALMDFLPQLYIEFLEARRENHMASSSLEFDFFTELCALLGIDNENMLLKRCDSNLSSILGYMYCLLDTILSFDVYQIGEDNANNGSQLKWFLNFTKLLLKNLPSFDVFRCLEVLLNLNHCIIEPHLNTIFKYMFSGHEEKMMDADHVSSCDSFLSSVVRTYVKLRQFDRLIIQMLKSIQTTESRKCVWKGFPDLVREELIKAIQSLPYGLSTSLWKTFNAEILQNYLPAFQGMSQHKNQQDSNMDHFVFSLEQVVGLFSLFLLNTTFGGVMTQHTVDSTQRTLSNLFHESVTNILGPLLDAYSNMRDNKTFTESACVSILMLFHGLQEVKIFLGKLGCVHDNLDTYWDHYVSAQLQKELKAGKQENERLKYLLVLLCIQRVRIQLLHDNYSSHQIEFHQLMDYIFSFCDKVAYCGPCSWNKQVWTIDEVNFSLAYWHCLCDHSTLLLTVCSDKQQTKFTQCLIQSLVSTDIESYAASNQNHAKINKNVQTTQSISKTLLHNAGFHQVPYMQDCLVSAIWLHIGEMLSLFGFTTKPQKKLIDLVTALGTLHIDADDSSRNAEMEQEREDLEDSENDTVQLIVQAFSSEDEDDIIEAQQRADTSLPKTLSPLIPLGKAFNSALDELESMKRTLCQDSGKNSKQLKIISKCFSMLALLPLDWLTDVNHSASILGLMTCDTLLSSGLLQEGSKECLKVLSLLHCLLNILLNGCISKKRFLINHVVNLDAFLSWMLSSYLTSSQIEMESSSKQLQITSNHLFCTLVKYSLRTASPMSPVYSCIEMLTEGIDDLTKELEKSPNSSVTKTVAEGNYSPLLGLFAGVLAVLEKVISHKTSKLKEVRMASKTATNMAPSLLNLLAAITMKKNKERHSKSTQDSTDCVEFILQDFPVLIDSYTAVLHIYCISQTSRKLSQAKEECQLWQWYPILPFILTFTVNSLQQPQKDSRKNFTENCTKSCLHFLEVVCLSLEDPKFDLPQDFHSSLLASLLGFLNQIGCTGEDSIEELRESALNCVLSLFLGSPSDILVILLKGLCYELTSKTLTKSSFSRIFTCLQVWSMILSGRFTKLKKKEICPVLPQVLIGLQSVLQMNTSSNNSDLSALTLEVMTKLLSLGVSYIQPHHCTLAFHGSLLVPLNDDKEKFSVLFQAHYSLLSSILFHQSEAVYNSVHVFVSCVKNLLLGLGQHCDYKPTKAIQEQESKLVCAQKMARLYQEIATHKTTFSKYAPYMIADYVQLIQQVSLQAQMKQALVPGVYCLLDMCGEHEMALLHTVLDKGSHQLFNTLSDDYNKFHKFKGKV